MRKLMMRRRGSQRRAPETMQRANAGCGFPRRARRWPCRSWPSSSRWPARPTPASRWLRAASAPSSCRRARSRTASRQGAVENGKIAKGAITAGKLKTGLTVPNATNATNATNAHQGDQRDQRHQRHQRHHRGQRDRAGEVTYRRPRTSRRRRRLLRAPRRLPPDRCRVRAAPRRSGRFHHVARARRSSDSEPTVGAGTHSPATGLGRVRRTTSSGPPARSRCGRSAPL